MSSQILRSPTELPPLPEGNLVHLLRSNPKGLGADAPMYISLDGSRVLEYGKTISLADELAYGLRHRLLLAPGDRIAIVCTNSIGYPPLVHACLVAGVVPVPLGTALLAEELSHPFADAGVKCVITDPEEPMVDKVREALRLARHPAATRPETVWLMPDDPERVSGPSGEKDLRELLEEGKTLPVHRVADAAATEAVILYSSGTTGKMKGARLSHRNLSASILMGIVGAPLPKGQRTLCLLPMYHGYAMLYFIFRTFVTGQPTVVAPRFDLAKMCRAIEQHKLTYVAAVPPIMVLLAKSPVPDEYDLSSLQIISCGAAPLSRQVADQVRARLGVRIGQGYAMTETSIALAKSGMSSAGADADSASCGQLMPGIEARLVTLDGQDVGGTQGPDGATEEGEIWVRGPNIFMGYLNSPEATRDSFVDGWFRTGDLAYVKNGLVYLTGRSKDLIKVSGRQVAPAELEAIILTFHKVADCAVVPLEDHEKATEYPLAYIVPKPEHKDAMFIGLETRMWVDRRVAHFKRLKGGVRVVDKIPKSPSGKILHRVLRAQLKAEAAAAAQSQPEAQLSSKL